MGEEIAKPAAAEEPVQRLRDAIEKLAPLVCAKPEPGRRDVLLKLGDHLVDLERLADGDRAVLRSLVAELGIPWSVAHQARWVASKIPGNDPARSLPLSYAQLRALAAFSRTARKTLPADALGEKPWSSRKLLAEAQRLKHIVDVDSGLRCVSCREPIAADVPMMSFRNENEEVEQHCCTYECAVKRFTELAARHFGKTSGIEANCGSNP